jgi:hypothetical protein
MQLSACWPCLTNTPRWLVIRLLCRFRMTGTRGEMKFLDICVIGLVSTVCLNRFPSPLRSLKFDLIAKSRLTMLSAVCQLVGLLDACDYFAARLSTGGAHHLGWIAVETIVWLSSGLLFAPACRSFLSSLFSNKSMRTEPVKRLHTPR